MLYFIIIEFAARSKIMTKKKSYTRDYIFVTPSFLMGMGSVLNIAGNYFPFTQAWSPAEADRRAIESDWGVVGCALLAAAEEVESGLINSSEVR